MDSQKDKHLRKIDIVDEWMDGQINVINPLTFMQLKFASLKTTHMQSVDGKGDVAPPNPFQFSVLSAGRFQTGHRMEYVCTR